MNPNPIITAGFSALLALALIPAATGCSSQKQEAAAYSDEIFFADPTIYAENGKYAIPSTLKMVEI